MTTVREATRADETAIERCHSAAIHAFATDHYDQRQIDAWTGGSEDTDDDSDTRARDEDDAIADPDQYLVVAERDGEVAGFGHLDVPESEVHAVYVHPDHAREGVGTALLSELEATAREHGLDALTLSASLNAVGFYERRGYERIAETTHELQAGVDLACVAMRREL